MNNWASLSTLSRERLTRRLQRVNRHLVCELVSFHPNEILTMRQRFENAQGPSQKRAFDAYRAIAKSARHCIAEATRRSIPADAVTLSRYSSDETFRALHACVTSFAREMRSLGVPDHHSREFLRYALPEAAEPEEAHPALVATVEDWFREAFNAVQD